MTVQEIYNKLGALLPGSSINLVVYSTSYGAILNYLRTIKPSDKSILIRAKGSTRDTIYQILQLLPETRVYSEFDTLFKDSFHHLPFVFHLVIRRDSIEGFVGCHDMTQEMLPPINNYPVVLSTFTIEKFIENLVSSNLEITEIQ